FLKSGNESVVPMIGMLSDHRHRVTGISHLWKHDQLGARLFGAARKLTNLEKIRLRIAEQARDLGNCNFHLILQLIINGAVILNDAPAKPYLYATAGNISVYPMEDLSRNDR